MARILAPILARILILLGWKKTVVFANLQATRDWVGWKGNPPDPARFYETLLLHMCLELLQFVFGFRRIQVRISPESIPAIEQMKQGGLMLSAHFGNWEVLGSHLRKIGVPLVATFQPFPHSLSNRILAWLRSRNGIRVERLEDSLFSIRNHFRLGNLFAFLADQDFRGETPSTISSSSFLGLPVQNNPLPYRLHRLFPQTRIFFVLAMREGYQKYLIRALESPTNLDSSSILESYNEWLESEIAKNPKYWSGWTHRRFLSTNPTVYSQL